MPDSSGIPLFNAHSSHVRFEGWRLQLRLKPVETPAVVRGIEWRSGVRLYSHAQTACGQLTINGRAGAARPSCSLIQQHPVHFISVFCTTFTVHASSKRDSP